MPRVSIVTPVYNDEDFIVATIASVREQTFTDWEHVVVDDGSADSSAELIAEQCAEEPRLRLIRQANSGASTARNVGYAFAASASEYLLFLDHDDILEPNMLERMISYMDRNPQVGVVFCRFLLIDPEGARTPHSWDARYRAGLLSIRRIPDHELDTPFETLQMWGGILPSNAVIRRTVYDSEGGGFDPTYFSTDTDLFMRLGLVTTIHRLHEPLLLYRRHPKQMSRDAESTSAELDRLLVEKWESMDLSPRDRKRFERGKNLRRYGADVREGIDAGIQHARNGEMRQSARFLFGAVIRYILYVAANFGLVSPQLNVSARA